MTVTLRHSEQYLVVRLVSLYRAENMHVLLSIFRQHSLSHFLLRVPGLAVERFNDLSKARFGKFNYVRSHIPLERIHTPGFNGDAKSFLTFLERLVCAFTVGDVHADGEHARLIVDIDQGRRSNRLPNLACLRAKV